MVKGRIEKKVGAPHLAPLLGAALAVSIVTALMSGCTSHEDIIPLNSVSLQDTVTYLDVKPIFDTRGTCITCHSGPTAEHGLRLDTYDNVMAGSMHGPIVVPFSADSSELYLRVAGIVTPRMPLGSTLSPEDIALIRKWINDGALEGPPVDTIFYADVKPIFDTRGFCISCHSGPGAEQGLRLDTYANVMAGSSSGPVVVVGDADASELYLRVAGVVTPQMPLGSSLTADDIALIKKWINDGAREQGTTE